jgi:hypothetical protein
MQAAQDLIFEQNAARINASRDEMNAAQAQAWDEFQAALDTKWQALSDAIAAQNAAWDANVAARTETMNNAVAAARASVAQSKIDFQDAMDASEKEIRWAITSIYNYDHQHGLNEALTAARAAMDASCEARLQNCIEHINDVERTWAECTVAETASLDANTDEELARCEASKANETDTFDAYKAAQRERFEAWAASETAALEVFVG